ncbi:RagB/SusD family nutrient uptake outer membrane protein [Pinibacter soli]|uniref:RagB/SusD family nutrient uptake outer membrane protein n=1 Tax=Pinibacter soli TaxID=3044211 RepID=A0ABT6RBD9_9BACT|nr:RagB/SusD family nutrient uptake outer membrane protein [Pinibacter soli]MDI3319828.1 RagB/SusD family nutrient uptake outer membrane protein [Pinibacter soli]
MNNKLIKKYIRRSLIWGASVFLIGSLGSCKKFLNNVPLDQISTPEFWKTPQELDAYIVGLYDWLPGQLSSSGMGYYTDDQVSDNMVFATNYNAFMNGQNSVTPPTGGAWVSGFTAIRQINTFFDNYQKCPAPFAQYQQTFGEACFLKALRYEGLVAAFGDVPWYSHVLSPSDSVQLYKARDPRSMVVDSIMNLLDSSIKYLNVRATTGVNRLNKETALIYKSRVALFEATWAKYHAGTPSASSVNANKLFQKAIDAFTQYKTLFGTITTANLYSTGGTQTAYYNLFGQFDYKTIPEVTLSKNYSQALNVTNQVGYIVWLYGYGGCSYSLDMVKSYLKKDGTYIDITDTVNVITTKGAASLTQMAGLLDPRFKQSVFIPGDLLNNNTLGYKDSTFRVPQMHNPTIGNNTITGFAPKKAHNPSSTLSGNYIDPEIAGISFRLPELMLNYAEAYVELNGNYPDLSDNIDVLRQRVGMPTLTSVKPTVTANWPNYGYAIPDALAIVRQERRVELAGEGFRSGDWKRWRAHALFNGSRPRGFKLVMADYAPYTTKPSVKVDANGYVDPYQATLPAGYTFNAGRDYLSPLPMDDLSRNKKLVQNPGWATP